jgi:hypothetical protein
MKRTQHMPPEQRHAVNALAVLRLRGVESRSAPLDPETYDQAAGHLRAICKITGETPGDLCTRLGITGYRRQRLIPGGRPGDPFRLPKAVRERKRRAGMGNASIGLNNEALGRRRAAALGIEYGGPAWEQQLARDRAFIEKMRKLRASSGPKVKERESLMLKSKSGKPLYQV